MTEVTEAPMLDHCNATNNEEQENDMGIEVTGLLSLIWLVIIIWAIVKTASSSAGTGAKVLWILLLLFLPLLGLILWLLLGPKG